MAKIMIIWLSMEGEGGWVAEVSGFLREAKLWRKGGDEGKSKEEER